MASGGQRDMEVEAHLGRTIESEFLYYAKSELAFKVSEELENANTGETVTLHLKNPEGSGVTAVFPPVRVSTAARSYVRVYDTFSAAPSGGTSADVQNVLMDAGNGPPDTGEITAQTDVTFTESSTHIADLVGSGVGAGAAGGATTFPLAGLEPGRQIVIEVEKLSTGPNEVPITARWYEVPVVYSQQTSDPKITEVTRGQAR